MDKASVIAEIRDLVGKTEMGPSDVSVAELAKDQGVGRQAIVERMIPLVESGLWETALKFDPTQQRDIRVYWKVGKSEVENDS